MKHDNDNGGISVDEDTPLRLKDAVKIAFPNGGMTLAGLRREVGRGRLSVEVIAGKQFTTIADIKVMRELCRVQAKAPGSISVLPDERAANSNLQCGSSETKRKSSPQESLRDQLKHHRQKRRKSS